MSLQDLFFVAITLITVTGAFFAVWLKNVFYNALSLILCLFGVASLFIFLNAEFLAVIEVIIYIGAISIAIIFAIMLSKPWISTSTPRNRIKLLRSVLISALLFGGILELLRVTRWPTTDPNAGDFSIKALGRSLLTTYALPFEVVSLVLLIAIIGALVVSASRESSS